MKMEMGKRVLKKVRGNSEGVKENERVTKYSKKVVREIFFKKK